MLGMSRRISGSITWRVNDFWPVMLTQSGVSNASAASASPRFSASIVR